MQILKKMINFKYLIIVVILLAFVLRIIAMIQLTPQYNIASDDLAFIESGIAFKQTGRITMHDGVVSAKNMPGMSFLIGIFALICGELTDCFWIAIKLFWIIMGCMSIVGIYKIIRMYANPIISSFICLFFLIPDFIWMDNLILTETPYMLLNIFLIYFSLKLGTTKENKYFWKILVTYILCLFIRPTIALFPLILGLYLILKKYNIKTMLKQGGIAIGILLLFLLPWWIRNYIVFNKFIPLTYGTGNPLLLGTYQGYGFPKDEELDYDNELYNSLELTVKKHLNNEDESKAKGQLAAFEYDKAKAKYRMKKWFASNRNRYD